MSRRGRFLLLAVCALMFATVGATGVTAAPLTAKAPAGAANQAASAPAAQSTVVLPGVQQATVNASLAPAAKTPCLKRGQTPVAGSSSQTLTLNGAAQPAASAVAPRPCADAAPKKTTAQLIAAATHARLMAGAETANRHAALASQPARHTAAPKKAVKPAHLSTTTAPASTGTAAPNVTSSITGTVTNASDAALYNIYVEVDDPDGYYISNTTTGIDGTYTIAVAPGDYTVWFSDDTDIYASGYYSASSSSGFTYDQGSASVVTVTTGAMTADVTLPLQVHITGTVTDSSADPLDDIDVQVDDVSGGYVNGTSTGEVTPGQYSIAVPPGTYKLWFGDSSGVNASGYYSTSGFTYSQLAASVVTVTSSGDTTVDMTLPPAIHITGTVTESGGGPLTGIEVDADVVNGHNTYTYSYTNTLPDGTYSIAVAPGSYYVAFYDDNGTYASGYYSTTGFSYDQVPTGKVVVTTADVTANVTLPLAVHINGKVTKSGGIALPGIDVFANGTEEWYGGETDGSGNYSIVVAPGTYTLSFQDESGTYGTGYYSTAGFTYDSSAATVLTVGSADLTGRNVILPLSPQIKGKVTATGGAPLVNIVVVAYNDNYDSSTQTAADGTYSISVAPGSYTLNFHNLLLNDQTYAAGYYSTAGFTYYQSKASLVTVGTANVTGKNVTLPLSTFISGTVTDSAAQTLDGIDVYADSTGLLDYSGYFSTEDGLYEVSVAPSTSYTLDFVDEGGTYGSGYYTTSTTSKFTYDYSAATSVAVALANVGDIDIALPPALHIAGTVTDPSAAPLSNIEVDLNSTSSNAIRGARPSGTTDGGDVTYTDDDGDYSFAVAPGDYTLYFADGNGTYGSGYYTTTTPSNFTYDPGSASTVTVLLADMTADVTLPLAVHITGKVTSSDATGLSNIDVYVDSVDGNFRAVDTLTDVEGDYSVAVPPDDYTVTFSDYTGTYGSGFYTTSTPSGFTYDSGAASPVHVASADATANVTLPLAIHIEGKVTKSGGTGLADIEVDASATNIDYYTSTVTDASGNYSVAVAPNSSDTLYFYDGSGKYGDGYYSTAGFTYSPTAATAVAVASADVTGKNVTLPLAVHIKGKVTKSGGTGLGDIEVYVADNFNTYETWTWTAADGTYSLTTAPGTYTLAFYDPSGTYGGGYYSTAGFTYYPSKATKVTVSSADVTGKNVTLPLAVYIEGKVTKSGGTGLGNIEVEAFNASYDTWDPTASDGTYFVSVAPGTYTLLFSDETGKYASGYYSTGGFVYNASGASSVTVASASITGKNVTLPLAVRITGKVTDAGDNGLPNIEIMASSADRTYANGAPSEADGTYSMPVIPGSYKVWFQDRSGVNGSGFYSITGFVYDEASASAVLVSTTDATDIDVKMVPGSSQVFPASTYYAIPPARVLDTRPTGSGHTNIGLAGKFTAGTVRTFNVAAVNYVGGGTKIDVPLWADAVTGNLTIVGETAAGLIALGPTMAPTGDTTTINFVKGDTRANNVTVGLSPDGSLSAVYRSSTGGATVDLIFDVTGYFLPWTAYGSTYHALAPGRVLDTRKTGSGHTNIGLVGKFANKVPRTFPVAGVKGLGWTSAQVPSSATAVTGNLTITNATSVGYVSVGPTIAAVPSTSTLNVAQGANIANGVTVALNAGKLQAVWDGTVGSSADVIFDITGYFTPDTSGLAYHPIVPDRLLDTSTNKGLTGAFTNLVSRPLVVGGVDAIPANAAGISGNLTVVNPSSNGFAFISPDAVASPTSSTININAHLSGANGFDVALDTGNLSLIWCGTVGSTADLQLDVTGYWK